MLQAGRGRKGRRAMATPTRAPVVRYLLTHATSHRALEQQAVYVSGLPEDDERLLVIATLAIRDGEFVPGPATGHALGQFTGALAGDCDAFITRLSHIARDDALARAREFGFLPPRRS
jgi:hypothetical protein